MNRSISWGQGSAKFVYNLLSRTRPVLYFPFNSLFEMLPSMPILFSASRDSVIEDEIKVQETSTSKETNNDCNQIDAKQPAKLSISADVPNFSFESIPEDEKECDDELVLLAENSPFGEKRKLHTQTTPTRKKRKLESTDPPLEDRNSNDEQANHFAMAYFMKAKGELDETTFQKFIALLSELNEETLNAVTLYNEIKTLLVGYPELVEEFIGFFHPHQALEVDKLEEFLHFEQSWNFFRKLDAFHLNKVSHLLEQQSMNSEVTNDTVRSSFLSAFKGHPNISEGLFGLLPNGKPSRSCKEDYEDISDLVLEGKDSSWERLSILDSNSRSCIPGECDCSCHSLTTKKFCTFCNVKFSKGQIYVQTGKGLRFAKVTFRGCQQEEVLWRLHPTFYNKPTSRKRNKSTSHQNKDSIVGSDQSGKGDVSLLLSAKETDKNLGDSQNNLGNIDEEDQILLLESQSNKDYINTDENLVEPEDHILETINSDEAEYIGFNNGDTFLAESSPQPPHVDDESDHSGEQIDDSKDEISASETDLESNLNDSKPEDDLLESITDSDSPVKSDRFTSGSECPQQIYDNLCILASRDVKDANGTDSSVQAESKRLTSSEKTEDSKVWTREEDKLILQAFQKQLGTEQTFAKISDLMPTRTVEDIQSRIQVLMNFLEQMTNGCYDGYPPS